ncbi:MAG: hypothetical protein R2724_16475 [Bryobacterales bacterium]
MTLIQKILPGVILAAGLFTSATRSQAQYLIATERSVYGRCAVEARDWRDNFGSCRLTGTQDGVVPAGWTLVLEHVSASCRGPLEHQVTVLALDTEIEPGEDMSMQTVIPLTRIELTSEGKAQYQASFPTRLYAGAGTTVETYLALENGFTPADGATCGVTFHGRLVLNPHWTSWAPLYGRRR